MELQGMSAADLAYQARASLGLPPAGWAVHAESRVGASGRRDSFPRAPGRQAEF
jgi:hypothetical protein